MMEYDCGYLVVGLDGALYYLEHVRMVWTIFKAELGGLRWSQTFRNRGTR
jgi:hypothetical protein